MALIPLSFCVWGGLNGWGRVRTALLSLIDPARLPAGAMRGSRWGSGLARISEVFCTAKARLSLGLNRALLPGPGRGGGQYLV